MKWPTLNYFRELQVSFVKLCCGKIYRLLLFWKILSLIPHGIPMSLQRVEVRDVEHPPHIPNSHPSPAVSHSTLIANAFSWTFFSGFWGWLAPRSWAIPELFLSHKILHPFFAPKILAAAHCGTPRWVWGVLFSQHLSHLARAVLMRNAGNRNFHKPCGCKWILLQCVATPRKLWEGPFACELQGHCTRVTRCYDIWFFINVKFNL